MAKVKIKEGTDKEGKLFEYFVTNVTIPIYDWNLTICVSTDILAARDLPLFVNDYGTTNEIGSGTVAFVESQRGRCRSAIFLPLKPKEYKIINTGTVVHECLHVSTMILDTCGVKYCSGNDESLSYLLEHVFNEVDNFNGMVYDFCKELLKLNSTVKKVDKKKKI